jgi:hypothetical protein
MPKAPGGDSDVAATSSRELFSVCQRRDEPPAFPRLEAKMAVAAGQREQGVGPASFADLLGEDFKRPQRRRADADRDDERRGHFRFFSTCALKPESCVANIALVSASQRFNFAMAPSASAAKVLSMRAFNRAASS